MKRIEIKDLSGNPKINIEEDTNIRGTFILKDTQFIKSQAAFIHKKPGVKSKIEIKAVLFDRSEFNFEGILEIQKGARNVDAYLSIKCLLLSDEVKARAVPSLEITENEVKGGHGATIGYLDKEQQSYLLSRGISKVDSEDILVDAFLSD